jgi:hypothetical protein
MTMWTKIKNGLKRAKAAVVAAVLTVLGALGLWSQADSQAIPVADNLSWTMPTQYVDGSTIPPGTLTGTRIAWDTSPTGSFSNLVDVPLPATTRQFTRAETYGRRCYKAAALVGTVNGEWTEAICKTVQAPARAPGNLAVQ